MSEDKPRIRWQAFQAEAVYPPPLLVEEINTTWTPDGVITLEAEMSMEKRAVVNTEKEKTAHEQVKKDLDKPATATGRTQTQKPNESVKPRSEEK